MIGEGCRTFVRRDDVRAARKPCADMCRCGLAADDIQRRRFDDNESAVTRRFLAARDEIDHGIGIAENGRTSVVRAAVMARDDPDDSHRDASALQKCALFLEQTGESSSDIAESDENQVVGCHRDVDEYVASGFSRTSSSCRRSSPCRR